MREKAHDLLISARNLLESDYDLRNFATKTLRHEGKMKRILSADYAEFWGLWFIYEYF